MKRMFPDVSDDEILIAINYLTKRKSGGYLMPRTLRGEKWEVQYRREVRSIKDGLTASPNGRGLIKATQLILKDFDKSTVVWCKDLPWTKKDKDRNLEIIRDAFNRTKDSIIYL